jgi:hypothetical protein
MDVVEEEAQVTITPEPPLDNLSGALIRNAVHQELLAKHDEGVRLFCLREDTPEDVLIEIYEQGLFLTELAHRKGPRRLLERIARETRYPEAVITIAVELYTSKAESVADFKNFLQEHSDSRWMLESVAHRLPSAEEKAAAFREVVSRHADAEQLLRLIQVLEWERQAKSESRLEELHRLFATREPKVWRSLVGNPLTPRDILAHLADVRDVPLAREIRNGAKSILAGTPKPGGARRG